MKPERSHEAPESNIDDAGRHVAVEIDWNVGAGGIGHRQRVSGPRNLVDDIVDTDNKPLLRWGVFVITFVPTVTTLIAKLPEIITALATAFGN